LGWNVDDRIAPEVGDAAEPAALTQSLGRAVLLLDRAERGQMIHCRRDPVLGELANALLDLTTAADPSAAADRIDVDAEPARGVEHGRPGLKPAAPSRRREDDEGFVAHGRWSARTR